MTGRLPNRLTLQRTAVRTALAGGLALTAMLAAEGWRAGAAEPMAEVWVTTHDIAPGDRLAAADLALRRWPATAVDPAWLGPGRGESPLGRIASARLAAGTPLGPAMVDGDGGSGLGAMIRPGRRAISIAVGPAAGLAGFLAPGDHVDVLLTQQVGRRRSVQTLVTDLAVLGIDSHGRGDSPASEDEDAAFADGPAPPGLVTLDVTPREAEALAVAAELGTLSLVLRGRGRETRTAHGPRWDSDVTGLPASLFAEAAPAPAAAPPPPPAPPAAAPATGGVAISYGLEPATASEAAK